jgi:hypothetical protein
MNRPKQAKPPVEGYVRGESAQHVGEGVDVTLIRWMLSLTPEERLRALEDNIHALLKLRNGTVKT